MLLIYNSQFIFKSHIKSNKKYKNYKVTIYYQFTQKKKQ